MLRGSVIVAAIGGVALLVFAGPAGAESAPPSAWAAAAQYVEMIPTSTGPKTAGAASGTKPVAKSLAAQIARRGGTDAQALETLVTSTGWGAAASVRDKPHPTPKGGAGTKGPVEPAEPATQKLAVPLPQESAPLSSSVGGGLTSGGRATFALVALVALLCLLTAFGLARRRSARSS